MARVLYLSPSEALELMQQISAADLQAIALDGDMRVPRDQDGTRLLVREAIRMAGGLDDDITAGVVLAVLRFSDRIDLDERRGESARIQGN